MDNINKDPQPLSPEEQLDLMLEKFLNESNSETPVQEDLIQTPDSLDAEDEISDLQPDAALDQAVPVSPEEQLDNLLASFQDISNEPAPELVAIPDEEMGVPELVSFWDIIPAAQNDDSTDQPAEQNDDPAPVILPLFQQHEAAEESEDETAEEADVSEDEAEDEIAEDGANEKTSEEETEDKPAEQNDDPVPVILPLFQQPEAAEVSEEENAEEVDVSEDEAEDEIAEDGANEKVSEEETEDEPAEQNDDPVPVILPLFQQPEAAEVSEEENAVEADVSEDEAEDETAEDGANEKTSEEETEDKPAEQDAEPAMILPLSQQSEAAEETEGKSTEDAENSEVAEDKGSSDKDTPATQQPADKTEDNEKEHSTNAEDAAKGSVANNEKVADTEDDEEVEEEDEPPLPPKKRRPKNTKAYGFFGIPHMLVTVIWLSIIVFIGVGLGKTIWNCVADVLALGRPDSQVVITITDEDDLQSIADKLKATGLIKYPSLFVIYGDISDAMDTIRTGTFKLNTLFDYHALVDAMSSNQRRETTSVTVPEGYTCAQMFRLLESKGVTTVAKLEAAAMEGDLGDYWFLEGLERDSANCLEGFLFPDTYTFYLDHDPVGVLQKFLDNFNKRFNDSMKIKLDTLNQTLSEKMRANGLSEDYIASHQMTIRDVVIIASMIEKETASNPESYNISSVIYNRLTNPEKYPYLNIDAALVYVLGHGNLTFEDLKYDSPYNTYLYPGLIPGAISNPGSYSLDAALSPTETEYYYYALDPATGSHHFSKTLAEHNEFLESIRKEEPEEEAE